MIATAVLAGLGILLSVIGGVLVHELLHVLVLRSGGVQCSLVLRRVRGEQGGFQTLVSGSWASVEMESIPADCSNWRLRGASMAPLAMLVPVGAYAWAVTSGQVTGTLFGSMVVMGWMACALPSPADFSVVWHTDEARKLVDESA
ncbi:hypothetical protein OB920_07440 [Halobacteria archaeon HArc-gm2]|nr:hypothetical protein [Halobacteria archaeon HArc-gm2]